MNKIFLTILLIINFNFNLDACCKSSEYEDDYTVLADMADAHYDKESKKNHIEELANDIRNFLKISNGENIRNEEIISYIIGNKNFKKLFERVKEDRHREIAKEILSNFLSINEVYDDGNFGQDLLTAKIQAALCMQCQFSKMGKYCCVIL